ncbi:Type I secretion target repeat protein [Rhodovulum sp. P5]|uniref:Hint domain-containing protein n=1 Tax=Rhodovulum sp. P5 TaxID=1564506 RepID=UPI0009C36952|nr:Hint domain-containing protein [Rhodovulum sp. P5]ARE39759.1 Type I secretion target repeat protein [Rhodovulum sp. P5]
MSFLGRIEDATGVVAAFPGGLAEGTNLRTPCGPRRVEFIRPGDMIVTRTGGLQPVRLVWRRVVRAEDMAIVPGLAPVRLKPRVLGPMMPRQDVLLAPDQEVLIPGWRILDWPDGQTVRVSARDIAGLSDGAYVDCAPDAFVCYQIVFDCPQVITANGLPVVSLCPTAAVLATLGPAERESLLRRFPQLGRDPGAYPPAEFPAASGIEFIGPLG